MIALRDEPRLEAADEIERADAALAALAAQYLSTGTATAVYIYTTDSAAGEGAEIILASEGYGDSVTFVNGLQFIEDLLTDDLEPDQSTGSRCPEWDLSSGFLVRAAISRSRDIPLR